MNKQPSSPAQVPASERQCRKKALLSGRRTPVQQGHPLLAPSLASAAVLLAVMGLSREAFVHEIPAFQNVFQNTGSQPGSIAGFTKSPGTAAPQVDFADQPLEPEQHKQNEITERRNDDLSANRAQSTGESGKEDGRLRVDRSRKLSARQKPPPSRENDGDFGVALQSPDTEENKRELELSGSGQSAFEQSASGRRVITAPAAPYKTVMPQSEVSEAELPQATIIGGAIRQDKNFDFLAHYQQTEGLEFQPATGYWANTYIPGDPAIRLLRSRLAQQDRSWLEHDGALEQDVEPVQQPFDAPANNALALTIMADTNSIASSEDGATRMRLQVGIRGIEHRRGQRPGMNLGIVLDLPADAPDDVRIATRALLDALLQSRQAGDQFSLVMTGSGLVVEAEDFRFGSLQVVKQQILGQNNGSKATRPETPEQKLQAAVQRATAMVQETDDPSRPLGSSSVLLISANTLDDVEQLAGLVHENASEGITLSIVPLGSKPRNEAVERLVLAGLGNRRFLEAPGQARQLIEEELHASSRAVARAARLSVRLAPGVRLIGMVGSERLDNQRAQRVREIENSMDLRLSTNLGIQADRGEDEDGIQVVIPSIFSGDSVTVLLDVVVDRPGAIADVSLRYKDLVFLRNGSLHGNMNLPAGTPVRGPGELLVLKNLLSYHFVEAVEQAAAALGRQQPAVAIAALSEMHNTIDQARFDIPAWANNPDLKHDQKILNRYLAALASPRAGSHQSFLTDSLFYAAWAKKHRSPMEWKL